VNDSGFSMLPVSQNAEYDMRSTITLWKLLPASSPESKVANTGVFVRAFILAKNRNSKPSLAIAYRILGRGNMAPNKLYQNKIILW
jgi:hypothetical protein